MLQVLCVGEALVDRLGPAGIDPALASADQCIDRLGGAPANVACALARLGTSAAFVGRLGTDAIGTAFRALASPIRLWMPASWLIRLQDCWIN